MTGSNNRINKEKRSFKRIGPNSRLRSADSIGLKKKLCSEKGASITFGLLLFLICAVISSVILVAGTSAAGRLSGMAKTEQRYYSVTSTAKVIQSQMESSQTAAIKVKNGRESDIYIGSGDSFKKAGSSNEFTSLADYVAYKLCSLSGDGGVADEESTVDLNVPLNDWKNHLQNVTVNADLKTDSITFNISCDDYSVRMKYSLSKSAKMPVDINNNGDVITGIKTIYNWELEDAKLN